MIHGSVIHALGMKKPKIALEYNFNPYYTIHTTRTIGMICPRVRRSIHARLHSPGFHACELYAPHGTFTSSDRGARLAPPPSDKTWSGVPAPASVRSTGNKILITFKVRSGYSSKGGGMSTLALASRHLSAPSIGPVVPRALVYVHLHECRKLLAAQLQPPEVGKVGGDEGDSLTH
jgi:hypothetical protein